MPQVPFSVTIDYMHRGDEDGRAGEKEEGLSLADVYWNGDNSSLDLKVKVIRGDEQNTILSQYMKFTKIYRAKVRELGKTKDAVLATLKECKEKDILKEYIIEHEPEVISIMMALYDKDSYMKLHDSQKKREGLVEGLASLVNKGRLTVEEAADESKMTVKEFREQAGLVVAQ